MATVRDIDYIQKRATIAYTDSQQGTGEDVAEVNLVRQNGLHESGPFPGDSVLIGFLNNDTKFPFIVGAADTYYADIRRVERDQHHEQGALLSDKYTQRKGETWNV
ncbi:hypothetical protein D3C76_1222080 [compost metagenome]